jgi:L-rhamnose isomerase
MDLFPANQTLSARYVTDVDPIAAMQRRPDQCGIAPAADYRDIIS